MKLLYGLLSLGMCFSGLISAQTIDTFEEGNTGIKVASWYQSITDYKSFNRTIYDVVTHLKETKTDFVFRAFWRYKVIPERCSDLPTQLQRQNCEIAGFSYTHLKNSINKIKNEKPDLLISIGIPTERINAEERNPITGDTLETNKTWAMALNPQKWGITNPTTGGPLTKEEFQFNRGKLLGFFPTQWQSSGDYDWQQAYAYYPDITNPDFQKLQLDWAKKMINTGADAVWIDMLFAQARMFYEITNDPHHPAVKESYEAALKLVDSIHQYGLSKSKYIYVGGWTNFLEIDTSYLNPDFDFVVNMIWEDEVMGQTLSEERWDTFFNKVKNRIGNDVLILTFMDEAAEKWEDQPLGIFSQLLTKEEQKEFLRTADEFFRKKREEFELPIVFVYPIHGGWMGNNATKLSYGKFKTYDAFAPEFDTYETIKELALEKVQEYPNDSLGNEFQLLQNYPNPFNYQTTISYQLPMTSKVVLNIYDILGREVQTLVNKEQSAGFYSIVWDGKNDVGGNIDPGIYFYRLKAEDRFLQIRKMMVF